MDKRAPSKIIKKLSRNVFIAACEGLKSEELFEEGLDAGWGQEGEAFWQRGFGPLHASTLGCHAEHTRRLIGAGADVNMRDEYAVTPLMQACLTGGEEVVGLLLGAGAETDCLNVKGESPLGLAAMNGSVSIVKRLLTAGAQVDYGATQGWTALTEACRVGQIEVVLELLAAGASVVGAVSTSKNYSGKKPGEEAQEPAEIRIWEPLFSATTNNKISCVRALLKAGARVDSRDGQERTVLMIALSVGEVDVVQMLMAAGADLDAKSLSVKSVSQMAQEKGPHWMQMFQVERARREVAAIEEVLGVGISKPRRFRL